MTVREVGSVPLFDQAYDYGLLPSLTGFLLRKATLLDFSGFGDAAGERAITPLRYSLLEIVGANPGLQQVQLATILGLSKPAATLAIDFWQSRDCLTRRQAKQDRRSHGIYLTEQGEIMLASLQKRVTRHDAALTAPLTSEELSQLRSLLQRIVEL